MKKALLPIGLILAVIVTLIAVMFVYEQKWGIEGPFKSQHSHGHSEGETAPHQDDAHDHAHDHAH